MKSFKTFVNESKRDPATAKIPVVKDLNRFLKGFQQYQHGNHIGWVDKSESKLDLKGFDSIVRNLGYRQKIKNHGKKIMGYYSYGYTKIDGPYKESTITWDSEGNSHVRDVTYHSSVDKT